MHSDRFFVEFLHMIEEILDEARNLLCSRPRLFLGSARNGDAGHQAFHKGTTITLSRE